MTEGVSDADLIIQSCETKILFRLFYTILEIQCFNTFMYYVFGSEIYTWRTDE